MFQMIGSAESIHFDGVVIGSGLGTDYQLVVDIGPYPNSRCHKVSVSSLNEIPLPTIVFKYHNKQERESRMG